MGKFSRSFADEIDLYVRQLAWLHAAPRPDNPGKGFEPIPRMRRFKDDDRPLPLPPCPWQPFVDMLLQAGPVMQTGQGRAGLSWAELDHWAHRTKRKLRPWDFVQLHRLSGVYLAALIESEAEACPPYWWDEDSDEGDYVDDMLDRLFGD